MYRNPNNVKRYPHKPSAARTAVKQSWWCILGGCMVIISSTPRIFFVIKRGNKDFPSLELYL